MKATMDKLGRIVIPKALREAEGLRAGEELDITREDGRILITPKTVKKRLEKRGSFLVLVPEEPLPMLKQEDFDKVKEDIREERMKQALGS